MNLTYRIKQINLAELVRAIGVELQQRGNNLVGLCSLHDETEPSFYVYPSNRFKCYGCGCSGDPADFIQELYGCDFSEALKRLRIENKLTARDKAELEKKKRIETERIQRERDIIYTLSVLIRTANKCSEYVHLLPAWEYYHNTICTGSKEDKAAIIDGLKHWPTISRNYLFRPDFNYRGWLREFLYNGVQHETERETSSVRFQCSRTG